jgi:hypothetical protein
MTAWIPADLRARGRAELAAHGIEVVNAEVQDAEMSCVAGPVEHEVTGTVRLAGRISDDCRMPGDDREQIRELLSQGLSTDAVAARLGASKGKVAAIKAHMTLGTYTAGARGRGGGIYTRQGGDLIALTETPYETEDVLQALLADHPGLRAGDELGDTPRRWVLLSREVRVADAEGRPGDGRIVADRAWL